MRPGARGCAGQGWSGWAALGKREKGHSDGSTRPQLCLPPHRRRGLPEPCPCARRDSGAGAGRDPEAPGRDDSAGASLGPSQERRERIPTGPRAWVAPGPDLPRAIRPDWTSLAREQRPRLCIHWPLVPGVPRAPPSGLAQGHPKPRDRRAPAADFPLPWLNSGRQWLWRSYPGAASSKQPSPLRGLWA
nr:neuropeptide-like protein C4orf48 homolog isoform X1 [Globicephala melas]